MKLRLTIVHEYEANPDHYGTEDPAEAARIDTKNFNDDPSAMVELIAESETISATVEVV